MDTLSFPRHTYRVQEYLVAFVRRIHGRFPVELDVLRFLEGWYEAQCDGDWEHQYGIEIKTLDNPGWHVAIDLEGTSLEGRVLERRIVERTEDNWWHAWSDGTRFQMTAGPRNLAEALEVFRRFVEETPI